MTASHQPTDESDRSTVEKASEFLGLWKTWIVAAGSVAIAVYAGLNPELAPGGYVPIFLAFAAAAVLYGVQKLDFTADPLPV
ncbi:hypothetical protein [Salinirubrum litoreum]|uniref:Uncharacterized protein n=1 Tax=Salinirubrum litoreum TaxID=1126234 RepID=A0ABD5R8K1_9EURY|nr:hypothetical protein [Salinirubrum litoreum]